jgi:hypothetical protein
MNDLLANPAIQSSPIPFFTALLVATVLGFSDLQGGPRIAGPAVLAGSLVAYVVALGLPPPPPKSFGQKIAYIAILAVFTGLFFGRRMQALAVAALGIVWIGCRKIMAAPSPDHLSIGLILAGTAVALFASERDAKDGADKAAPLLIVCFAMAGLTFMGASASIAQNAPAVSAALGGLLVMNWPKRRFGPNATARLVPIIVLAALATQIALFTTAPAWVLALLLPALFADQLLDRLPAGHKALTRPVLIAFIASVPAVATLLVAWYAVFSTPSLGY